MFATPNRPFITTIASLALGLILAGGAAAEDARECGGYPAPQVPDLTPVAAAEGSAKVVTPFGEVELPSSPGRALGMYTTDVDILVWLGFPLATSQPIRGDSGYQTLPCFFPLTPLRDVATFGNYPEYNYEQILLADPDFILNGLGYDKAVNERLPQIAPTYSVDAFDGRSWQEHFRETAEALGRLDRYEAWLAVYQARLAQVKEAIKDNADVVVAPLSYWDSKYSSGCYTGVECTVFRDLGLTIFEGALVDGGNGISLSAEEVSRFASIDYAFTGIGIGEQGMAEHESMKAEALKNPLWAELDFVKADHLVPFEFEMLYGSPSGQLAFLEVVAVALTR